jgi:hypothetical protein
MPKYTVSLGLVPKNGTAEEKAKAKKLIPRIRKVKEKAKK